MQAKARIIALRDGRGHTHPAALTGESPLLVRRTGPFTENLVVHLVGGAAGPLRGDDLHLSIEVGPGAHLTLRSVAAQIALPGRDHLPASRMTVTASVAPGGTLHYLPEPLIAAAGCDHRVETTLTIEEGGTLLWRDDLVCGRHAEPPGDMTSTITLRHAARTLYRHDLSVGPHAPAWSSPAILGGARAIGTLLLVGSALPEPALLRASSPEPSLLQQSLPAPAPALRGEDAALMPLAGGPAMLATAVGPDIRSVQRALDPLSRTD
jgi:urease accessory protein